MTVSLESINISSFLGLCTSALEVVERTTRVALASDLVPSPINLWLTTPSWSIWMVQYPAGLKQPSVIMGLYLMHPLHKMPYCVFKKKSRLGERNFCAKVTMYLQGASQGPLQTGYHTPLKVVYPWVKSPDGPYSSGLKGVEPRQGVKVRRGCEWERCELLSLMTSLQKIWTQPSL